MGWLEAIVVSQTALPASLFIPGMTRLRIVTRILAFLIPMAALGAHLIGNRRTARKYPPAPLLAAACGWMAVSLAHPLVNTLASAGCALTLTMATCSPAFWGPACIRDPRQLRRLIWVMLLCNGASAVMGMAQFYRPERFSPPQLANAEADAQRLKEMEIELDDGRKVQRPPGLTDMAGGAAHGACAALGLGLAAALAPGRLWWRALGLGLSTVGLVVMFFSQVRVLLITAVLGILAWAAVLALRREVRKLATLALLGAALGTAGIGWVMRDGGKAVMKRFLDLFEDNAAKTFQRSRGGFIEYALTEELPTYPLGAGPGRTGMASAVFGNVLAPVDRRPLYAETQIEVWVLDGGLPLLILYPTAVILAFFVAIRTALTHPDQEVAYWSGAVLTYGVTVAVASLGGQPFITAQGVQFWCLFAAAFGAAERSRADSARAAMLPGAAPR